MTNALFYLTFTVVTNWHHWDNATRYAGYTGADTTWLLQNTSKANEGYDLGEVRSNVVANTVFSGKTNGWIVESKLIGFARTDWHLETKRIEESKFTAETNDMMRISQWNGKPELVCHLTNAGIGTITNSFSITNIPGQTFYVASNVLLSKTITATNWGVYNARFLSTNLPSWLPTGPPRRRGNTNP